MPFLIQTGDYRALVNTTPLELNWHDDDDDDDDDVFAGVCTRVGFVRTPCTRPRPAGGATVSTHAVHWGRVCYYELQLCREPGMCMCVCVNMFIFMCVCVCVCVCTNQGRRAIPPRLVYTPLSHYTHAFFFSLHHTTPHYTLLDRGRRLTPPRHIQLQRGPQRFSLHDQLHQHARSDHVWGQTLPHVPREGLAVWTRGEYRACTAGREDTLVE
jgi:hypothetical protein